MVYIKVINFELCIYILINHSLTLILGIFLRAESLIFLYHLSATQQLYLQYFGYLFRNKYSPILRSINNFFFYFI